MSKEEKLFDRSMRWVRTFRSRVSNNPSIYQAYAAGWKAAMRDQKKDQERRHVGFLTECDMHEDETC